MRILGLTGGIGMGKSAASGLLQARGVPVVDTDVLAREIVEPGRPALDEIGSVFGPRMMAPDGTLRRDELARLVFSDGVARQRLESITHPRIRAAWLAQLESWRSEARPLAVVIIPLLFETHAEPHFDATVCVACSSRLQMQRLQTRGWSPDIIRQRIQAQMPVDQKMDRADYVIWNDSSVEILRAQLDRIVA